MEEEYTNGSNKKNIKDNGNIIKCQEMESQFGKMEIFIKGNFKMANIMVLELLGMKMALKPVGTGKKEESMAFLLRQITKVSDNRQSGIWVKGPNH